jgi:hypothetical protein
MLKRSPLNSTMPPISPATALSLCATDALTAATRPYLSAKGLTQVASSPDLNVRYHFGSARRTEVERYPAGWRGFGTRVVRIPYTEGTLVIDLHDTASRTLVWRSIAHEDKNDPDKIAGKLDEMVKKSIAKYP